MKVAQSEGPQLLSFITKRDVIEKMEPDSSQKSTAKE